MPIPVPSTTEITNSSRVCATIQVTVDSILEAADIEQFSVLLRPTNSNSTTTFNPNITSVLILDTS